jgi:hypothetical protein
VPTSVTSRLKLFQALVTKAQSSLSPAIRAKVIFAQSTIQMWEMLDSRTKNILQSCIAAVLNPFLSVSSLRYWDELRGDRVEPAQVLEGRIVVVSVPAGVEPGLATVLGRLVKMDFYEAAQRRNYRPGDRIVSMIQDEYPYSVTAGSPRWSDITNLATLRARGACLIAATQGLANLNLVIGPRALNALLLNFSNLFFFRSQETALDAWTERLFGLKPAKPSAANETTPSNGLSPIQTLEENPPWSGFPASELACPRGALSRLQTHQAYVSLANGTRTQEPLWLAPRHVEIACPAPPPAAADRDMELISQLRDELAPPEVPDDMPF